MSEITYEPFRWNLGGSIDPDNGQGLRSSDQCSRFECQKWEEDTKVAPRLVEQRGFLVCPCCCGSFGATPKGN
jgi:hypothetical protein